VLAWALSGKDNVMTPTEKSGTVERIIESGREAEEFALEAVRNFLDTVDSLLPDVGQEGPRRKIIDSAFTMTEQLVDTWTQLAEKIPDVVRQRRRRLRPPRRMRARKATAKKATTRTTHKVAKRAPVKKAATRTTRKVAKRAPVKKATAKKATAKKAATRTTRKVAKRAPVKKAAKQTTRKVAKRRTPA